MRKLRLLLATVAALAGLAACDTPLASPDIVSGATDGSASRAAAPAAPEAQPRLLVVSASSSPVDRFPAIEFLLHLDAEHGRLSVHAPSDFCSTFQVGVLEAQAVTTPSEIDQYVFHAKGDSLPVAIYEADSFADAGIGGSLDFAGFPDVLASFGAFCAFLTGPDRIAEGTVRRVSNLSNASFAVTWTGTLDLVSGGRARLTELYQLTADADEPNDESQWSVNASKVLVR